MHYEFALCQDYLKQLKKRKEDLSEHITTHALPHEEYVENVGKLNAIRELEILFIELKKQYFPN